MNQWLWWAVGTFGLGGVALIGAVLIFGWPVVINSKLGRAALAIGAAAIAIFAALAKAKQQGAADERAKQEKANAAFRNTQNARDAAIARSTDADLDNRLREHPRKPGARP